MVKNFIRNLTGKNRNNKTDAQLGVILAFIAGAINAGGFLAVGYYTSHMTGIVSSIADFIALNNIEYALFSLLFLFSFISGAITSSIIINIARTREPTSEFALALMLESILLLVFGLSMANHAALTLSVETTISLLCFIMGLQNAIITKISGARIRTTHVTGISTDIGIEIGRYFYSLFGKKDTVAFQPDRLKLHSMLLFSFLIGGIFGAFSFKNFGFITTMPLAFILAILASIPVFDDFTSRNKR